MIISNLINERGNAVKNQFVIVDGTNTIFQSYKTVIATIHNASAVIIINKDAFHYSNTTTKHFLGFLREFCMDDSITRRDVEQWMRGEKKPVLYNTDFDIISMESNLI